jgi:hypothetical protein
MSAIPLNRYIVMPPWNRDEVAWNPYDLSEIPIPDCAYLGRILVAMERAGSVRDLTFYITSRLDTLPSYGSDVIAIVLSDEWCRIPRYAFKVRAIFKTYGTRLDVNWRAFFRLNFYELSSLAQDLRTLSFSLPYAAAFVRDFARQWILGRTLPAWRIYDLPLGYFRQIAVPFVAINERQFDVFFAGSTVNRKDQIRLSDRFKPKFISRATMLKALRTLAAKQPQLAISTTLTSGFAERTADVAVTYSLHMMQTKLCLVPRGTSLETYRFFEGIRFGCVILAERLPHRWFYDGAPVITVPDWRRLSDLIPDLLADSERLASLSEASLRWWSERCSEDAVGTYVAKTLSETLARPAQLLS